MGGICDKDESFGNETFDESESESENGENDIIELLLATETIKYQATSFRKKKQENLNEENLNKILLISENEPFPDSPGISPKYYSNDNYFSNDINDQKYYSSDTCSHQNYFDNMNSAKMYSFCFTSH